MRKVMAFLKQRFSGSHSARPAEASGHRNEQAARLFRIRYNAFRDLLESNSELLGIISELQEMLDGEKIFGRSFIATQTSRTLFHATRMVDSLETLSGDRYPALGESLERIASELVQLGMSRKAEKTLALVLPLAAISRQSLDIVGGKAANLGELRRLGLPVPEGFAVTTGGFDAFMAHEGLLDAVVRRVREVVPDDAASVRTASHDIQELVRNAPLPSALEEALLAAYAELAGQETARLAMRSSAVGEDGELSYAGQYATVLNVDGTTLLSTYKQVVASLFSERAMTYRLYMGEPLEASAMSVLCLTMVDARSGGVLYTRDPVPSPAAPCPAILSPERTAVGKAADSADTTEPGGERSDDVMVLDAVWGLGAYAVDGVITPDRFMLSREAVPRLFAVEVADKYEQLVMVPEGGTGAVPVPEEKRRKPCLDKAQCIALGAMGMRVEDHYGTPQDIEWAVDSLGNLVLLQARPLRLDMSGERLCHPVAGGDILYEGGDCASAGVGSGRVVLLEEDAIPTNIAPGTVLVVRHPSPQFVPVLVRAEALVAETGSVTGHLASLAREFGIPALFTVPGATALLPAGETVTLDALCRRIYRGEVAEVLERKAERIPIMAGTAMLQILRAVADVMVPLNLTNPNSSEFCPQNCRTVHDIMRFAHEMCYQEMFCMSDMLAERTVSTVWLRAPLPVDLHIIDLGGGMDAAALPQGYVEPEQVRSEPFAALLNGMLDPAVSHGAPRPVSLHGFLSVMNRQMLEPPTTGERRFGERSYAIVSDRYLNFSSRVGYHYSVLDAFCGPAVNSNYVHFEFKGGAAGDERRGRRVRALAIILAELGFVLEVRGDRVAARYRKYPGEETRGRICALGRLLIYSRQMDMLMHDEASVQRAARHFLHGEYDQFS